MSFLPNPKPSTARSRYPRWTLRDGTKVRLEDLSNRHLARCIKRCEDKAKDRWPTFAAECYRAAGYADEEGRLDERVETLEDPDHGWEVCLHPMHEHLVAEAERRGIDVDKLAS